MKRILQLLLCVGAWEWSAHAGPDEEFAEIIAVVQKGDQLMQKGQDRPAMDEYRKAQESLLKFRQAYPRWDSQVVAFRLRYVGDRLGNWTEPTMTKGGLPDAEQQALQSRINFLERSTQQYQAQVNQLLNENSRLSARLREALAIRPAALEPAAIQDGNAKLELAQQTAKQLEVRVRELEAELAGIPKPEEAKRNARLLEETRRNLNQTVAEAEALRQQLAARREQPVPGNQSGPAPEPAGRDETGIANEMLRVRAENEQLRAQLAALINQLRAGSTNAPPGGTTPLGQLERARLALAEGRTEEAVQLLQAESAARTNSAEAWYLLGRAHLERAEFDAAATALARAKELAPELGAIDFELARWQARRPAGDLALARWQYHRALQRGAPRDPAFEKEISWEPVPKAPPH